MRRLVKAGVGLTTSRSEFPFVLRGGMCSSAKPWTSRSWQRFDLFKLTLIVEVRLTIRPKSDSIIALLYKLLWLLMSRNCKNRLT